MLVQSGCMIVNESWSLRMNDLFDVTPYENIIKCQFSHPKEVNFKGLKLIFPRQNNLFKKPEI